MAQLGSVLRITLGSARVEQAGGIFPWQRGIQPVNVWMEWRAEARRRAGTEWLEETVARGRITGAEVLFWAEWFSAASEVRKLPTKLGKAPNVPVARLWTPLAGAAAEFFLWPDPTGALALMALFTPDEEQPHLRQAVEATVSPEDLAAFGAALASEYEALKSTLRP